MSHAIRLEGSTLSSARISLIDRSYVKALAIQVREMLTSKVDGRMEVREFLKEFSEK